MIWDLDSKIECCTSGISLRKTFLLDYELKKRDSYKFGTQAEYGCIHAQNIYINDFNSFLNSDGGIYIIILRSFVFIFP